MIMLVGGSDDATTAHQQDGVNLKLVIALMLICGAVWIRKQVHGMFVHTFVHTHASQH
jgi:hypothetical protein